MSHKYLLTIFFFCTSLYSMDAPQLATKKEYSDVLTKEVIEKVMMPLLDTFQDVARMRRVCKAHTYFDPEKLCVLPEGCASKCSVHACRDLVGKFKSCTRAVAHFAQKNEKMFNHLWIFNQKERDEAVCLFFNINMKELEPIDRLDMYRGAAQTRQQIIRRRIERLKTLLVSNNTINEVVQLFDTFNSANDPEQKSILHYVVSYSSLDMLKAILPMCENVDITDIYGCTPLHYASRRKHSGAAPISRYLITKGADCNILDKKGNPALDF